MHIYLRDQTKQLPKHLAQLRKMPVINYDKHQLKEKETIIEIDTSKEFHEIDLNFLFDYKIFPDNIMTSLTQWRYENRDLKIGDTIVQ